MWMGDIDAKLHAKTEDLHSYRLKPFQSVNSGATQTIIVYYVQDLLKTYIRLIHQIILKLKVWNQIAWQNDSSQLQTLL